MHGYSTYLRKTKERNLPIICKDDWLLFWKFQIEKRDVSRIRKIYNHQMMAANRRNIAWLFNIEEWIKWWEQQLGPNWVNLRGCRFNQYVMARIGDVGPYAPCNVKCILATENSSEGARIVGDAHHMRRNLIPSI